MVPGWMGVKWPGVRWTSRMLPVSRSASTGLHSTAQGLPGRHPRCLHPLMSHSPEDNSPPPSDEAGSARILPFEPRQNEMHRALQARAQDALERERAQRGMRFQPLKWLIILCLSAIPVAITLLAVDGFLRAMQKFMNTTSQTPAPAADGENIQYAPPLILKSDEPGVVLIQPSTLPRPAPQTPPAAQDAPEVPPTQQ